MSNTPNTQQISAKDMALAAADREAGKSSDQQLHNVAVHVAGSRQTFNSADNTTQSTQKVSSVSMSDKPVTGSVFDSAERNGSVVEQSRLTPDSTIEYQGMRMT